MTVRDFQLQVAAKNPCRVASTSNVDVGTGGLISVDGVTVVAGDRVLLKDQSTGGENGIYIADSGSWTRSLDMDAVDDDRITAGLNVYIQEGSANTKKTFYLTTTGTVVLGTTALTFEQGPTAGAGGGGTTAVTQTNAVFVSKAGSDGNDGLTKDSPKLTIGSAITAASGLSPTSGNKVEIHIQDAGTYAESVTLPDFVSLIGPTATLTGSTSARIIPGNLSTVRVHRLVVTAAGGFGFNPNAAGTSWLICDEIANGGGSTSAGIKVDDAGALVIIQIGRIECTGGGTAIWDDDGGTVRGSVGEILVTSSGWGLYLTGGQMDLSINRLADTGSGTDGVDLQAAGSTANLFIGEFDFLNTYESAAGTFLNLFVGTLSGTPGTNNGTVLITQAGGLQGTSGTTDNAILRADGTAGTGVQGSGVLIDDSDNISATPSVTMPEQTSAPVTPGSGNGAFWVKQTDGSVNTNIPMFTDEDSNDMALVRSVELQRSMPASTGDSVDLGTISISNGQVLGISVFGGPASSSDYVAYHRVVLRNAATTGGFQILRPLYTSGPTDGSTFNDKIQIEIDVAVGGLISLRARSYFGVAGDIRVRLIFDGDDRGAFTSSSTQATTTAPTTNFGPNMLTMAEAIGNLSIGNGIVAWKPFYLQERATANGNVAGYGQLWVRNDSPNTLIFTSDSGTDRAVLAGDTGATDNAILRADGTGGSTPQGSTIIIDDAGVLSPNVDDAGSLGSTSRKWSDLFIASGGVLNFNAGDVTVTHSAGTLLFAGGTAGYDFDNPFFLTERAAALAGQAGKGQLWVRNDTPNVLVFTDDAGTDTVLGQGGGGGTSVVKNPTRAATASDVTLSGGAPDTVDGVALAASDRILVWNQSTASENGIYVVTTLGTGANGTWTRATDFDDAVADDISAGTEVYVQEGDNFGRVKFLLVTTGAITIGSTSLEFVPMGGLVRSDASSTEIQASTTFSTSFQWTSAVNLRDHSEIAIWFDPTDLNSGSVTDVEIVIAWSDDGSTIAFSGGEYNQLSDFNITNQTDGSYLPKVYTANLTSAGGELAEGVGVHLSFPKRGGFCRIGVKADDSGVGAYTVRSQRLTT